MGFDGMRVGGGRCPPLFIGGLLVACFLLICNWWSLSTENIELVRQLDELNNQLKISDKERDESIILQGNAEKRYQHLEEKVGELYVRLQQQNELKKENGEVSESLAMCKSELDSLSKLDASKSATLATLRLDKDTMLSQLDAKEDENQKLKTDLETALNDLEKLKLSGNVQKDKEDPQKDKDDPQKDKEDPQKDKEDPRNDKEDPQNAKEDLTRDSEHEPSQLGPGQLGTVDESAVKISVPGQRGMRYHGIPILPRDPPGYTRQAPRLSVTMLKDPNKINGGGEEINPINEPKKSFDEEPAQQS